MEKLQASISGINASLGLLLPELVLGGGILLVLVIELIWGKRYPWLVAAAFLLVLGADLLALLVQLNLPLQFSFNQMLLHTGWGTYLKLVAWLGTLGAGLLALQEPTLLGKQRSGELWLLFLGVLLGAQLLSISHHLLMGYLSLEMISLCSYALTAYKKDDTAAAEAATKYMLFGVFSSALMLYGISLLYTMSGSLLLGGALQHALLIAPVAQSLTAGGFVLVGLLFKLSAAPFHFWAPDVYQGASTPVAALLATAPKAGAVALLLHLHHVFMPTVGTPWIALLGIAALASLLLGNLAALGQRDFKRLLAYSTIAHAGFLLLGLATGNTEGEVGTLWYTGVYVVLTLGAFAGAAYYSQVSGSFDFTAWAGQGRQAPLLAASLAVVLIALTGLPPTAGFIAKLNIFLPLWGRYQASGDVLSLSLLLVAVLLTVVSLVYYLRPVATLLLQQPKLEAKANHVSGLAGAIVLACTLAAVCFGLLGFGQIILWLTTSLA